MDIFIPALIVAVIGLILGALLGMASKKFYVKTDERVEQVRAYCAGAGCGACGFASCDAFAEAVVKGEAPVNGCRPGGNEAAKGIRGKIRAFFDPLDWADAPMPMNPEAMNSASTWSMNAYRQMVKESLEQEQEGAAEAWDELEKSVVSNIADDVKVSIQGRNVEMIIFIQMHPQQ